MFLDKFKLEDLYTKQLLSAKQIAVRLGVTEHKVNYWLDKYEVDKRSVSEALYSWHNPDGDPFIFSEPVTKEDHYLWGMGLGLYWGEGNKANKNTVKLGNTDPKLIKVFISFLERFFQIRKKDFKFHLHLFTDMDLNKTRKFWENALGISKEQFYKPTVTITGKLGNYRKKSKNGVITVYYGNTKVRNIIVNNLPR